MAKSHSFDAKQQRPLFGTVRKALKFSPEVEASTLWETAQHAEGVQNQRRGAHQISQALILKARLY